ncbi:hypothetical protein [Sporolactobacillus putidus]|uniref:Serine aminopeptidase S33 domain-containing protein n=1 Tax=Sporolactobacillus putidus TaxID=492735 RepID=A0A917S380_9BACL|nr:hypothetical protein [Sporolactobacillus putidus]GGL50098.1 hypothetical protein GCM10007968_12850 [Sporolactobacillus putidus]
MQIKRDTLLKGTAQTPCVIFSPDDMRGTALIMHGYGGSNEEQLGLAFRIAETGLRTVVIDLHGHGENSSIFNGEKDRHIISFETGVQFPALVLCKYRT